MVANKALRKFSWEAEYMTGQDARLISVANQAEYLLPTPPDWKRVSECYYDAGSGGPIGLDATDENNMRLRDPVWAVQSASQPRWYWMSRSGVIRLHPVSPDNGKIIYVRGVTCDVNMSNPTDIPNCAELFHEGIALYGAWYIGKSYAKGEARARVESYWENAKRIANECRQWLDEQGASAFQRSVNRRMPQRLTLGGIMRNF